MFKVFPPFATFCFDKDVTTCHNDNAKRQAWDVHASRCRVRDTCLAVGSTCSRRPLLCVIVVLHSFRVLTCRPSVSLPFPRTRLSLRTYGPASVAFVRTVCRSDAVVATDFRTCRLSVGRGCRYGLTDLPFVGPFRTVCRHGLPFSFTDLPLSGGVHSVLADPQLRVPADRSVSNVVRATSVRPSSTSLPLTHR